MKQVVEKRKDIAFFIKMYPLVQIHPQAYDKSKAIVCAKTNEEKMQLLEDAFAGKELPKPSCETAAIDANIQLAGSLGISGTPALIFGDGKIASGAIPVDQIISTVDNK